MHPPRSNSAYQVNPLGEDKGEGADQSAANQIEGREETPVWQKAFVLGPNVRFTRTPDRAPAKPEAAPASNFIQTVAGRNFIVALRLYGTGVEFFDRHPFSRGRRMVASVALDLERRAQLAGISTADPMHGPVGHARRNGECELRRSRGRDVVP